ncbi:TPA: hypothetical protein NG682_004729 [Vibrio parahaemolyticus]|uniref:hypothetical protein n=1 Tax=Vibrio parahaemolyticus TaxID=670 RepID=UPI001120DA50|nr:hypothetical protein [Vibrio parahaemolyticus]MDF4941839.1 hypothetical protein [Vibrio parahaemolyticus]TOK32066.1 hypothetical protein CGI20_25300 [Vibrio parahaemolyticus]HCE3705934.1 hypothetical protein [Vibrio parahaemolyticus]HCG6654638.1 hypothetical protein [Vibrio parahaemolyticus]
MKFEFGDLYKFIVSLGVVLITISIMVPWFFLKEPFDLFRPVNEINALSEVAKSVIEERQNTISLIVQLIPWFSLIGSIIGSILIYFGLKNWYSNQVHIDEQTRLDVEIKKQSLRDATKDEIEEKETAEYQELQVAENSSVDTYRVNSFRGQYSEVEELVYSKFLNTYQSKYEVSHNKMIAGVELDILLKGKHMLTKDYIVEVKYIRKGFNFGWLREAYLKNIYAKSVYSQMTNRLPNTLLLIVINENAYDEVKYKKLLQRLSSETIGRSGKDIVRVITKQELTNINSADLQEKVSINA